jgi:hypothetical protein
MLGLSLAEREEISRGLAQRESMRVPPGDPVDDLLRAEMS